MKNITYLIGAGASAKALPMNISSRELPNLIEALDKLASDFDKINRHLLDNIDGHRIEIKSQYQPYFEQRIIDLRWLSTEAKKHDSIDTYAHFLYVNQKREELIKLKKVLSFYFIFEQRINRKIDKRPLNFLTKIMQKGPTFPENVKIISWNYDFQLQLAATKFYKESKYDKRDATGTIYTTSIHRSLIQYFPALFNGPENDAALYYSLVHMNGIAGHLYRRDSYKMNPLIDEKITDLNSLFDWETTEHGHETMLTFAWENDENDRYDIMGHLLHKEALSIVESIANNTDILVIIGYSFPTDNRKFDRIILNIMLSRIERIYIQNTSRYSNSLLKEFNIEGNIDVVYEENCDRYFIPPELAE